MLRTVWRPDLSTEEARKLLSQASRPGSSVTSPPKTSRSKLQHTSNPCLNTLPVPIVSNSSAAFRPVASDCACHRAARAAFACAAALAVQAVSVRTAGMGTVLVPIEPCWAPKPT